MNRPFSNPVRLSMPTHGVDGRTTLAKARAPLMADGRIGDFFVDTVAKKLYGPKNAAAWPDNGLIKGDRGWVPVLAAANDNARRVIRIIDWQGGEGTKPTTTGYLGVAGPTAVLADAIDFRGPVGPTVSSADAITDGTTKVMMTVDERTALLGPFFDARRRGAAGDGGDDFSAIQDTIFEAAALGGGTVWLQQSPTGKYRISETLELPYGVTLSSGSRNSIIQPSAAMDSLIRMTGRFGGISNVGLANFNDYADVGVALEFLSPRNNNVLTIENSLISSFVRGIQTNGNDCFVLRNLFTQNNSELDLHATNGCLNALISGWYSLGSSGGFLIEAGASTVEGVQISQVVLLPTEGKGIVMRGGLACSITQSIIDQCDATGIELDGDNHAISDVHITSTWVGTKEAATSNLIGFDVHGNVSDSSINGCQTYTWQTAGIRLKSTSGGSVQRFLIENNTMKANGSAAADLLIDTSVAPVSYIAKNNRMTTTGGTSKSIIEGSDARGFLEGNTLLAPITKSPKSQWFDNYGDDLDPSTGKFVGWTTYTPTLTAATGTLTSVATAGRYRRDRNNVVHFEAVLNVTNNGTGAVALVSSLPLAAAKPVVFVGREDALTGKAVQMYSSGDGATSLGIAFFDNLYPGGTGAEIFVGGTYECVA